MKNLLQISASNPQYGAWVSASAGTGKTKILTDRAIRLLLESVEPSKILCITFTNAAAGEMQDRILYKLRQIAASNNEEVTEILTGITGETPSDSTIFKAKSLYENYLRNERKINIHTLHSYCQKILQKFPLEASVTPSFSIIDEAGQMEAIASIRMHLLKDQRFATINKFFAENYHPSTVDEIFSDILQDKTKFLDKLAEGPAREEQIQIELADEILGLITKQNSGGNHIEYQPIFEYPLIQQIVGVDIGVTELKNFFLTKDGKPRKRIVSSKIAKEGSSTLDELLRLQEQVYILDQRERSRSVEYYSKIINIFASNFLALYHSYKLEGGCLDYDDLIIKTKELLTSTESRSWVLYKLDGGIDHILVDEAQDTSPSQWVIIEALIEEFFAGQSRENRPRTIFVVGDEKQSIFSFQGAEVQSFIDMNEQISGRAAAAGEQFVNIKLDTSYRSSPEILEFVYRLFSNLSNLIGAGNMTGSMAGSMTGGAGGAGDISGGMAGGMAGSIEGHVARNAARDATGNATRNATGNAIGNALGNAIGNALGNAIGNALGNAGLNTRDNATGNAAGRTIGNAGNFRGNALGNFTIPEIGAYRKDHPGRVELWNLCEEKDSRQSFWDFLGEQDGKSSARTELANKIAQHILELIETRYILPSTAKPAKAGDFMILFRTRGELTNEVIAALHKHHIPTSGLDRIKLTEDLLIKDIKALAKFALNPLDRLNEAAIDNCPLLMQFGDITTAKEFILDLHSKTTMKVFFTGLIEQFNIRTLTAHFYGISSLQALDELLVLANNYSHNKDHSLYGFISWLERQELEIKRETESLDMVKIMTVHGSKGLQAPVVIMCDTTSTPTKTDRFLWKEDGTLLTAKESSFVPESFVKYKDIANLKTYQEYLRLLYVAMTRAEDQLIICGYGGKKSVSGNCWYELARKTMQELEAREVDGKLIYDSNKERNTDCTTQDKGQGPCGNILYFTPKLRQKITSPKGKAIRDETARDKVLRAKAVRDGTVRDGTVQDEIVQDEIVQDEIVQDEALRDEAESSTEKLHQRQVLSPIIAKDSIKYGLIFHKILEDAVRVVDFSSVKNHPLIATLTDRQQRRLLSSLDKLLDNEDFLTLLDGDIKTELSIGSHKEGTEIGRIDLIIFKDGMIHIIDYKTDSRPPQQRESVPQQYSEQLESYATAMKTIFPNHNCRKYLLWLENAKLMEI